MSGIVSECQWCINPLFMGNNLPEYLSQQSKFGYDIIKKDGSVLSWHGQAYQDLQNCFDCVVCYHDALDEAFLDRDMFPVPPREDLYRTDVKRLKNSLTRVLLNAASDDDELSCNVFTPFKEILKYPRYLLDEELSCMVVDCIQQGSWLPKTDFEHKVFPGIYLLLIHPMQEVQRWALETVKSLDPIDYLIYDELEEVIGWLMRVIHFNLLQDPPAKVLTPWDLSQPIRLPNYLIPVESHKTFWIGMCMLIKSMDKNCIQSHLLSSTSEHKHLVDAILHTLEPNTCSNFPNHKDLQESGFWPALQTFSILLEILDAFFWQSTSQHPNQVCKMILGHAEFIKQLQCLAEQHEVIVGDDDILTNSQYVYASRTPPKPDNVQCCLLTSSCSEAEDADEYCPQTLALPWILPFASSVIGFGDVAFPVLKKILAALYSMLVISLSPKPVMKPSQLVGLNIPLLKNSMLTHVTSRKLSDMSLCILAKVVELLFQKELYGFLIKEKVLWLPVFSSDVLISMITTPHKPKPSCNSSQSGIGAVRSAIMSIIRCPAGQNVPTCARLMALFSPKFGRTLNNTLPHPPSANAVYDTIFTVLTLCNSQQDVAGPYVTLKQSDEVISRHREVSVHALVKKEETDIPRATVKEETIDDGANVCTPKKALALEFGNDSESRKRSRPSLSLQRRSSQVHKKSTTIETRDQEEKKVCSTVCHSLKSSSPIAKEFSVPRKLFKTERVGNKGRFVLDLDDENSVESGMCDSSSDDDLPSFLGMNQNLPKSVGRKKIRKRKHAMQARNSKVNPESKEAEQVIIISSSSDAESDSVSPVQKKSRNEQSPVSTVLEIGPTIHRDTETGDWDDSLPNAELQDRMGQSENIAIPDSNCMEVVQTSPPLLSQDTVNQPQLETQSDPETTSLSDNLISSSSVGSHTDWFSAKLNPTSANTFSTFVQERSQDGGDIGTSVMRKRITVSTSIREEPSGNSPTDLVQQSKNAGTEERKNITISKNVKESSGSPPDHIQQSASSCSQLMDQVVESCDNHAAFTGGNEPTGEIDELFTVDSQDPDDDGDEWCPLPSFKNKEALLKSKEVVSSSGETTSDDNCLIAPPVKRRRLMLPLRIESDSEVKDDESDYDVEEDHSCMYNKSFPLPSCASEGREMVTQPQVKPRPVKLNLDKLTRLRLDQIREQVKQGKLRCTSPFTKYKNQCDDFLQFQNHDSNVQNVELIVSIDQSVVASNQQQATSLARKSVSDEQKIFVPGTADKESERKEFGECTIHYVGGDEILSSVQPVDRSMIDPKNQLNLQPCDLPSSEIWPEAKGIELQVPVPTSSAKQKVLEGENSSREVNKPPPLDGKSSKDCGVIQRPKFSRSRMSSITSGVTESINNRASLTPPPPFMCITSGVTESINNRASVTPPPFMCNTSGVTESINNRVSLTLPPFLCNSGPLPPLFPQTNEGVESSTSILKSVGTEREGFVKCRGKHSVKTPVTVVIDKPSVKHQIDDLYKQILNWPVDSFFASPNSTMKHPISLDHPLSAVPITFSSYDQYFNCYVSLTLAEIWDTIFDELGDPNHRERHPPIKAELVGPVNAHDQFIRCEATVSCKDLEEYNIPTMNYLVKLEFIPCDSTDGSIVEEPFSRFAIVQKMYPLEDRTKSDRTKVAVNFKMRLVTADLSHLNITEVCISSIMNLTTHIRQWEALLAVHRSPLFKDVLHPRGGVYFGLSYQNANVCMERNEILYDRVYNSSQHSAIKWTAEMVKEEFIHPRILLLQGPPGTGKTHTIVGMVQDVLQSLAEQHKSMVLTLPGGQAQRNSPHILVCALSNSGVDEIAIRLMKTGLVRNTPWWRGKDMRSDTMAINVVRIGDQRIHSDVKCVSVESLVDKARDKKYSDPKSCNQELQQLKNEVEDLESKVTERRAKKVQLSLSDTPETGVHSYEVSKKILALDAEISEIVNRKAEEETKIKELRCRRRAINIKDEKLKKKVLLSADVVFCSLSTCGRSELRNIFKDPLHFNCVIVDEASYCSEMDVLIPMAYGSSKLILVGDPAKAPAVVKSKTAESLGLGRSMFERMNTFLKEEKDSPVRMLQTQCRMVPLLCKFPSDHFYSSKLATAQFLKEPATNKYSLNPFLLYNVEHGQDKGSYGKYSFENGDENELVRMIVEQLIEQGVPQGQIGVITPYRGQEKLIKSSLNKKLGSRKIDVGNAESFQGREKDVIILSCVKTKDNTNTLGFLSSLQKMNVALTRSKLALYVLGRCESLKVNKDWIAFIRHAEKLGKIIHCPKLSSTVARSILIQVSDHGIGNVTTTCAEFSSTVADPRLTPPDPHGSRVPLPSLGLVDMLHSQGTSSLSIINESLVGLDDNSTTRLVTQAINGGSSSQTLTSDQQPISTVSADDQVDSETESTSNGIDHEPVCYWPDSQSISREVPVTDTNNIDYTKQFPSPPSGFRTSSLGGQRKRIAHASTEEINLLRNLAPLFRQERDLQTSNISSSSTCVPQQ